MALPVALGPRWVATSGLAATGESLRVGLVVPAVAAAIAAGPVAGAASCAAPRGHGANHTMLMARWRVEFHHPRLRESRRGEGQECPLRSPGST